MELLVRRCDSLIQRIHQSAIVRSKGELGDKMRPIEI
jgi:hypothetical protein